MVAKSHAPVDTAQGTGLNRYDHFNMDNYFRRSGSKKTMKGFIILLAAILILFCGITRPIDPQQVSDEARRHFDRGMAAVEMAATAEHFESAIKEFEQAVRLAPNWPDAYYNLGMVQEKVGKFAEAILSLRRYLRLSPYTDDADAVKSLINKLEYRAENVLTVTDIIDVLVEYMHSTKWTRTGEDAVLGYDWFEKEGENSVRFLHKLLYYRTPDTYYQTLKVEGPSLEFSFTIDQCHPVNPGPCPRIITAVIEVISKTHVRVKGTKYWVNRGNSQKQYYSCEYRKIAKGADINARDDEGRTPLLYAESRDKKDVADLLRKHGAK